VRCRRLGSVAGYATHDTREEESSVQTWKTREARPADEEAVRRINLRAWSGNTTHELLQRRHGVVGGRSWEEHIADAVGGQMQARGVTTFVAEQDGAVIGYAMAQMGSEKGSETGTVSYNAVDPDHRNRGVGTSLVSHAMDHLKGRGARVLTVVTLASDEPVRRIYERLGFGEVTRLVYYSKEC